MPFFTFTVTVGSRKLAVPISIAVAPAIKNSIASSAVHIPPSPTTGIFTPLATWLTILTATGFTAGPLKPPVPMLRREQRRSMSIDIPIKVLMSETESAPSASTALAISTMLVTFGESFTISVLWYFALTAFTTLAAPSQVTPNAIPPSLTLGQEIFNSMAGIFSSASIFSAQSA